MRKEDIINSPKSAPQRQMLKFMDGERLSYKQSILAKCFECTNGFIDGRNDCGMNDCPLYPFMPYNPNKYVKHVGQRISRFRKAE
jgi:hypothetical protein